MGEGDSRFRKVKISKTTVDAIRFESYEDELNPAKPFFYVWDMNLKGFSVRVSKASKIYYAIGRVGSKKRFIKLGVHGLITAEQARKNALAVLSDLANGIDPTPQPPEVAPGITLGEAMNKYFAAKTEMKKSNVNQVLNLLRLYFGDEAGYKREKERVKERTPVRPWMNVPLAGITRGMFFDAYQDIKKESLSQAEKVRRNFHAIAKLIIDLEEGRVIAINPAYIRPNFRHKVGSRELRIPKESLAAFHEGLWTLEGPYGEIARDYLKFTLIHGLRREESAGLTRNDVDMDKEIFTIMKGISKNKFPHILPITGYAMDIVSRRMEAGTNFLFPSATGHAQIMNSHRKAALVMDFMESKLFPGTSLPAKKNGCFAKRDIPRCFFTIQALRKTFADVARSATDSDMASRLINHRAGQGGAVVTRDFYFGPEDIQDFRVALEKVHAKFRELFSADLAPSPAGRMPEAVTPRVASHSPQRRTPGTTPRPIKR